MRAHGSKKITITRQIKVDGGSMYKINGKKASHAAVRSLTQSVGLGGDNSEHF